MGLRKGDTTFIARALKCSHSYVKQVVRGDRNNHSLLARKIMRAKKTLEDCRREIRNLEYENVD